MPGEYSPGVYEAQRRGIDDDYAAKSSANAYSRTLSQQRGNRQIGQFQQNFRRELPGFNANFARRGLSGGNVRSGVHSNAFNRYVGDYQSNLGGMQADLAGQDQQFALNQMSLDQMRQSALADLEAQRQQQIALAALNISAVRPLIGG